MTEPLSLSCWIVGEDPTRAFTVKVSKSENIHAVKKAVKEVLGEELTSPVSDLDVWAVAIPLISGEVNVEAGKEAVSGKPLEGVMLLEDVEIFKSINPRHLHVVVKASQSMSST
jgi:hypothetical protein